MPPFLIHLMTEVEMEILGWWWNIRSVIMHLLSQVRLGMDLTKVVLPTYILERRSVVGICADCLPIGSVYEH